MLYQDIPGDRTHEKLAAAPADVPVTVLGYASVRWTDPSDQRELTLQATAIDHFCTHRGWELVELINDIQTPAKRSAPSRPSLMHALQRLRNNDASCLMVAELKRLCGSIAELGLILEVMRQADARLISLAPALDTATVFGRTAPAWESVKCPPRFRSLGVSRLTGRRGRQGSVACQALLTNGAGSDRPWRDWPRPGNTEWPTGRAER